MEKNKLLIVFFLVGLTCSSIGQSYYKPKERTNSITFAPFNLFDFINPSAQVGYEKRYSNSFAYQIEAAYIVNHSIENYLIDNANGITDCDYTNKGFKIRGEFKYYFAKGRIIDPYLSAELFYLKNRSGVLSSFIVSDTTYVYSQPRPPGQTVYEDFYYNDKQRIGINLKFGFKLYLGENLFLEPHLGIGLVYRISKQYDRENLNDQLYGGILDFNNKAGNMWIPNLPFNLKVGYRF